MCARKKIPTEIVELYQSLPLGDCINLYRIQHANLNHQTRRVTQAIIGCKAIYGAEYKPNKGGANVQG